MAATNWKKRGGVQPWTPRNWAIPHIGALVGNGPGVDDGRDTAHDGVLGYRPVGYFGDTLPPDWIGTRVKGQARREMARRLIEKGDTELPHELTDESLSEDERVAAGGIHPLLMSGEYLPDLDEGEVEIARVILRSVTGDVMSVRARPAGGRIAYRVVDEYEDDDCGTQYEALAADGPLTLGELLEYLETCCEGGILTGIAQGNLECGADLEDLEGFVRAESAFYPDLAAVVDARMQAWAETHRTEDEDEDEDEEEGADEDAR